MNPRFKKKLLPRALLLAGACAATSVSAYQIEEVVVTAQKRAESLQDVPVSISALGSGDLEGLKLRASTEIAAQVPNMQMQTPFGDSFPLISMRGISMSDFTPTQSSPVAIYVDEIYKGNPAIQGVQLFDVERVEVLRGPQGTLYGKNTTGGAVNFITKKPTHETEGYLTVGLGDYARKEAQGAFQTSLVDDVLAMRVAGTWTEADGYNENKLAGKDDLNSIDEWGARVSFAYTPTDEMEAIVTFGASEQSPTNAGIYTDGYGRTAVYGGGAFAGLIDRNTLPDLSGLTSLDEHEFQSDNDEERKVETESVSLTINYDLSDTLSLTSITSYDSGEFFAPEDTDGTFLDLAHIEYGISDATQWAQDLRIVSDFDGPFNYLAGLYWAEEEIDAFTNIDVAHAFVDLSLLTPGDLAAFGNNDGILDAGECFEIGCVTQSNQFTQTKTSTAAYFHGTLDLNDSTTVTLGLRYTEDEAELSGFNGDVEDYAFGVTLQGLALGGITQADLPVERFVNREWSGKLGIDHTTDNGTLVYANYSKGFRGGSFNSQAFADPNNVTAVDPENVDAYEIGFKSELFDGSMQLNGAAFYYDYTDQQVLDVDAASLTQTLINIDESTIQGIELEMIARPSEALMLRAGLGWIDSEVSKGYLDRLAVTEPESADLKGNELPAAPELNLNLSADYTINLDDLGSLVLHLDTNWSDDHSHNITNTVGQDDYWLTNGRVSFEAADDSYTVAFWVKNIEDKVYKTYSIDLQALGFDYNHLGAPRTMGIEATFRF
ncbi:MAG: TonB-dependent receptor [Candidatus Pelagadaptatus aseana]|uniref:TonB-dependent receptor n=1 Tax=Candidatus Pelagadaptatus aseana TaxID=3120508 RepID=UPI0039B1C71B